MKRFLALLLLVPAIALGQVTTNPNVTGIAPEYREGTWTPSLGGDTTYTSQVGIYTKIGKLVCVQGQVIVNAIGTGSTTTISGLPFTIYASDPQPAGAVSYYSGLASSVTHVGALGSTNSTSMFITSIGAAGVAMSTSTAIFGNAARVNVSMCYRSTT